MSKIFISDSPSVPQRNQIASKQCGGRSTVEIGNPLRWTSKCFHKIKNYCILNSSPVD